MHNQKLLIMHNTGKDYPWPH